MYRLRRIAPPLVVILVACEHATGPEVVAVSQNLTPRRAVHGYQVTDLGTLGGTFSSALAINDLGQVVGTSQTGGGASHAFLWDNGVMTDLGTLGGTDSGAFGINALGQVIGQSHTGTGRIHAFLSDNGAMTDLGTLGGPGTPRGSFSSASAINDLGQVVGVSRSITGSPHSFLWQNGVMKDIGTFESFATAINNLGQVVGFRSVWPGAQRAFMWQSGVMTDLGTLGGIDSRAHGISDLGQVVGYSRFDAGPHSHAFLWKDGVMTDLGHLGGNSSLALGINSSGQVVGYSHTGSAYRAVVWDKGTMLELGTLGGTFSEAFGINDLGQVVGYAATSNGEAHAALWTRRVQVAVDIKPNSDPNAINCEREGGVVPVAILTTSDFDALTVDHTTVSFEGADEVHEDKKTSLPRRHEEDADWDGDIDLVFHFRYRDTGLTCGSTEGTLTGEMFDGTPIVGSDAVRMVGG